MALACALAACSSSGDGDSAGAPTTSGAGSAPTSAAGSSAAAPATGDPIDVFFINEQGASSGASYPQETVAAKGAVDYINNKLGGVNGRPIKLTTCFTDATPASTTTCANKAVTAKPVIISAGTLSDDNDIIAVTGKTDIPYVSNSGFTAETLTAKGKAFIISNYADAFDGATALMMKEHGVKKTAIIYVNVPAVVNGLIPLTKAMLDKQGVKYELFPVPYPSADLSPTISTVASKGVDAIEFNVDPITCGAALNAIKSFGFDKPLYASSACRNEANSKIVSTLSQTVYGQLGAVPGDSQDDPDAAVLREVFSNVGLGDKLDDQWAVDGFTDIFNIYGALKKAAESGEVTSASVITALQSGGIHQYLMGPDATYTCDGSALPDLPALCGLTALMGEWKGGKIENVKTINGADALK